MNSRLNFWIAALTVGLTQTAHGELKERFQCLDKLIQADQFSSLDADPTYPVLLLGQSKLKDFEAHYGKKQKAMNHFFELMLAESVPLKDNLRNVPKNAREPIAQFHKSWGAYRKLYGETKKLRNLRDRMKALETDLQPSSYFSPSDPSTGEFLNGDISRLSSPGLRKDAKKYEKLMVTYGNQLKKVQKLTQGKAPEEKVAELEQNMKIQLSKMDVRHFLQYSFDTNKLSDRQLRGAKKIQASLNEILAAQSEFDSKNATTNQELEEMKRKTSLFSDGEYHFNYQSSSEKGIRGFITFRKAPGSKIKVYSFFGDQKSMGASRTIVAKKDAQPVVFKSPLGVAGYQYLPANEHHPDALAETSVAADQKVTIDFASEQRGNKDVDGVFAQMLNRAIGRIPAVYGAMAQRVKEVTPDELAQLRSAHGDLPSLKTPDAMAMGLRADFESALNACEGIRGLTSNIRKARKMMAKTFHDSGFVAPAPAPAPAPAHPAAASETEKAAQ